MATIEQENMALKMRLAAKDHSLVDKDKHIDEVRRAFKDLLPLMHGLCMTINVSRCPHPRFLSFHLLQLLSQTTRLQGQVQDGYANRERLVQESRDSLAAMESEIQVERANRFVTCTTWMDANMRVC